MKPELAKALIDHIRLDDLLDETAKQHKKSIEYITRLSSKEGLDSTTRYTYKGKYVLITRSNGGTDIKVTTTNGEIVEPAKAVASCLPESQTDPFGLSDCPRSSSRGSQEDLPRVM